MKYVIFVPHNLRKTVDLSVQDSGQINDTSSFIIFFFSLRDIPQIIVLAVIQSLIQRFQETELYSLFEESISRSDNLSLSDVIIMDDWRPIKESSWKLSLFTFFWTKKDENRFTFDKWY